MAYGFDESPRIPVEVKAGGVVFFNGYLLYQSLKNRTETGYRRVLVNHYLSCKSLLPWTDVREGGPMARAGICRVFAVAGAAPYAWKGMNCRRTPPIPPLFLSSNRRTAHRRSSFR